MNTSELRLGNIVSTKTIKWNMVDCAVRAARTEMVILEYQNDFFKRDLDEIDPIIITKEWLLKFGFTLEYTNGGFTKWEKGKFMLLDGKLPFPIHQKKRIDYVHELQNLYFALTGEELTVKQ